MIAVYDLGGGTFDAAVLRKEGDGGFTMLGTPEGIEHLGGIDVDAAVFAHVTGALGDAYEELDPDDLAALAAVARLRLDCTQAKEALSLDTETTVPVLLPTIQTEVRYPGRAGGDDPAAAVGDGHRPGAGRALGRPHARRASTTSCWWAGRPDPAGGRAGVGRPGPAGGGRRPPWARDRPGRRHRGRPRRGRWRPTPPARHRPPRPPARPHPRRPPAPRPPPRSPPPRPHRRPGGRRAPASAGSGQPHCRRPGPPRRAGARPGRPSSGRRRPPLRRSAARLPCRPAAPTAAASTTRASSPRRPHLRGGPVRATAASAGLPAAATPAPGLLGDLPPGYLTTDARATRKKKERRKRRLMISLGVVLVVAAVAATLIIQDLQSQPETVASLEVGECFTGEATDLSTVDRGQPHNGELYFLAAPPTPPGPTPASRSSTRSARPASRPWPTTSGPAPRSPRAGHRGPAAGALEDQWDDGTTDVHCVAVPAEGGTASGSIKGRGAAALELPEEHRGHVVDVGVDELELGRRLLQRHPHDVPGPQGHHLPPVAGVHRADGGDAEPRGRAPGRRPWRAALLHVAEHDGPGLVAGALLDRPGQRVADAAEARSSKASTSPEASDIVPSAGVAPRPRRRSRRTAPARGGAG